MLPSRSVSPSWFKPVYEPSKRRVTWPNGAMATLYSADEPKRLRGPQHDAAWCDELASWRYAEAWDMLLLGLRLGRNPQVVVTTTPRPTKLIRALLAKPTTVTTRGTTYDNRANLAPEFFADVVATYEGTDLGRQEIYGEVIDDLEGVGTIVEAKNCYKSIAPEPEIMVKAPTLPPPAPKVPNVEGTWPMGSETRLLVDVVVVDASTGEARVVAARLREILSNASAPG